MSGARNLLMMSALSISIYALGALPAQAELPRYAVKDLGTFGGAEAVAADLNDAGQVTGGAEKADFLQHAFLYDDGELRDLGTLGKISFGTAINASGQVAGETNVPSGSGSGFVFHQFKYAAGVMTDLGAFFPTGFSHASAINNRGEVAGNALAVLPGEYHATVYTGGRLKDVGPAGASNTALAINDAGEVAGSIFGPGSRSFLYTGGKRIDLMPDRQVSLAANPRILNNAGQVTGTYWVDFDGDRRGFIYDHGKITTFGPLKGGGRFTLPQAISSKGHATGTASDGSQSHAFVFANGHMTNLGTLPGAEFSSGTAINDWDEVTGSSDDRAFVYAKGRMWELHSQLESLGFGQPSASYGVDINNSGQVIGTYDVNSTDGEHFPFATRSFIATPIPLLFSRLSARLGTVSTNRVLVSDLSTAQSAYTMQQQAPACDALYAFEVEARSLQTRGKISAAVADELVGRAQDIATPLACSLTAPL